MEPSAKKHKYDRRLFPFGLSKPAAATSGTAKIGFLLPRKQKEISGANEASVDKERYLVQCVMNEIIKAGGVDVKNRFSDAFGNHGLANIKLELTTSRSGSYVGKAVVTFEGIRVNVFIKAVSADENPQAASFLTEACIYNSTVSKLQEHHPHNRIPTLLNNYAVIGGVKASRNRYKSNTDFMTDDDTNWNMPSHVNAWHNRKSKSTISKPIYIINEPADHFASSAVLASDENDPTSVSQPYMTVFDLLRRRLRTLPPFKNRDYVRKVFFDHYHSDPSKRIVFFDLYEVFVQILLTISLMHKEGLYHNDLHTNNMFIVFADRQHEIQLGEYKMRPKWLLRVFDWDHGFSKKCTPSLTQYDRHLVCQSSVFHDAYDKYPFLCYSPHEQAPGGDLWMVLYCLFAPSLEVVDLWQKFAWFFEEMTTLAPSDAMSQPVMRPRGDDNSIMYGQFSLNATAQDIIDHLTDIDNVATKITSKSQVHPISTLKPKANPNFSLANRKI